MKVPRDSLVRLLEFNFHFQCHPENGKWEMTINDLSAAWDKSEELPLTDEETAFLHERFVAWVEDNAKEELNDIIDRWTEAANHEYDSTKI